MDISEAKNKDASKITGNRNDQSKQLNSKSSQLTDSDLKLETDKENEFFGRVESRLSKINSRRYEYHQ